ncbi:MAG: aminopeptidase P family N-terminal domain-containing protein, partial [Actinomycetota bacterium]|nr:aminopeptidase P family N-terminal domain-containing protein [Actinomycetota bacterium]
MNGTAPAESPRAERMARVRSAMGRAGLDALLLSLGADLPWLSGYEAMPLERLTMLVVPIDAPATLVVPGLEAPRVTPDDAVFGMRPWAEAEDPVAIVAGLIGSRLHVGVSDRTWATFVLGLQDARPEAVWSRASMVTGPLRAVKDAAEIEALAAASAAADRVAADLLGGAIPLI